MIGAFDDPRNARVDELRGEAEHAERNGDAQRAHERYALAAALEAEIAASIPDAKPRTRSLYAISAAALWRRADDREGAAKHAHHFLANRAALTSEAERELDALLQWASPMRGLAAIRERVRRPYVIPIKAA